MRPKLVILDRDGVINEDSDQFIKSADEFIPIPGSIEAIASLKQQGFLVAIATNQSGIARGLFSLNTLNAMHQKLSDLLAKSDTQLDYIAFCPHGPNDQCNCRKPKPGLLKEICQHFAIHPSATLFIGDSFRDYEAACALKMPFNLVTTGKGQKTLSTHPELEQAIDIYPNLQACVRAFAISR